MSKFSNKKEKESPNINNLNNKKINMNNNYINNSNMNNYTNNNDFILNSNINMPYPIYPIEKFPYYYMDEEKDYAKINLNKILISDSKDINKSKKEPQFPCKFPQTGPFYRSDIKNSSESSGGNNSLGKMTPAFRMNPSFMTSNDKFFYHQNFPQNRGTFSNPKIQFYNTVENNNNNNNKISTDSNSIHSYSFNQSMISANSAFKKSSSGSGSGSGRNFQPPVGEFTTFNNINKANLNKQYFSFE